MTHTYRIKTREEFEKEGRLTSSGNPEGWNGVGHMNHFMGQLLHDDDINFSPDGASFNLKGHIWIFQSSDLVKISESSIGGIPGLRTPVIIMPGAIPVVKKKTRGPSKSSVTEGKDAYGEKVYIGDTVVYAPSSSTIFRGIIQSFTPKSNPRVKIEGYDNYVVVCMRPYVKVTVSLNSRRMIDMIGFIK